MHQKLTNPPKVVLLSGVIGSGKTGYGFALINSKNMHGLNIAYLRFNDYKGRYFQYQNNEDDSFLSFLKFCQEVDVLFLDDFGMFMTDKSKSLIEMAKSYINLVEERSKYGKLTIITIPSERNYGKTIKNYLEYLKKTNPTVFVGDKSVRSYLSRSGNIEVNHQESIINMENNDASYILGKDWLVEKYSLIEQDIDEAIKALLRPEEQDYALRERLLEEYGDDESREDEILSDLQLAKRRLNEYKSYISLINFDAILFHSDGKIEKIKKE